MNVAAPLSFGLIVTGGQRVQELDRLFRSLDTQDGKIKVTVVVVLQEIEQHQILIDFPKPPIEVVTIRSSRKLSLSEARNQGLRQMPECDFVAFPDDDCWYPRELLSTVAAHFQSDPDLHCLCTAVIDPKTRKRYGRRPLNVTKRISGLNLFSLPISVGIFLRYGALKSVGAAFRQDLGAGTDWGSGEETELVARILERGGKVKYDGFSAVFHPVPYQGEWSEKKLNLYGKGTGFIGGELLSRGHLGVVWYLSYIVIASAVGSVFVGWPPAKRAAYYARLRGVLRGLSAGFRYGAAGSSNVGGWPKKL